MLTITRGQIKALDIILLGDFLKKAERFLLEEAPGEMTRVPDATAFVEKQYGLAKKAGHKTERAIVQYMLEVLTN